MTEDRTAQIAEAVATMEGRPCPFCGSKPYVTRTVNGEQMFKVGCASCGLELKAAWYRDELKPTKDILALWNSRPASVPPEEPRLTFDTFSAVNRQRCESPEGFNHALGSWSTSDWFLAVLGELGEAANIAKKLNRVRDGIPGNKESADALRDKLRKELGDAFVYLDLLAQSLGVSIGAAVVEVFNAKSEELGCPIQMRALPAPEAAKELQEVNALADEYARRHGGYVGNAKGVLMSLLAAAPETTKPLVDYDTTRTTFAAALPEAAKPQPCKTCQGRGWIMKSEHHDLGVGQFGERLGAGGSWNEPCPDCAAALLEARPSQEADRTTEPELIKKAREATNELRDAAREGRVIDFKQRDQLVMAIHHALDVAAGAPPLRAPQQEKD